MKIVTHVALLFALLFVTVATAWAVQPIDLFNLTDQAKWNCAKSIAVATFPVSGEFKGEKPLEYYQNDFAGKLAASLRKIPGIEKVDVVDGKTPVSADILIKGDFKDLSTGSRALRFWIGFGAGKSFCRADMKGIDPKSGSEVFTLDHARGSAMDIISDDELMENIDEVVEDVSAGLMAARRACGVQ
jgi:hypothetical protein